MPVRTLNFMDKVMPGYSGCIAMPLGNKRFLFRSSARLVLQALCLVMLVAVPGLAEDATPTAPTETSTTGQPEIELAFFTMEPQAINGVVPAAWDEIQPGTAIRSEEGATNTTYIVHFVYPNMTLEDAVAPLLAPIQIEALPEPTRTYSGAALTWTVYDVDYSPPELDGQMLHVTIAGAESDETAYVIVLQNEPQESDRLYEMVLLPALDVFGLSHSEILAYLELPEFIEVTIDLFQVTASVPADWRMVNPGAYMRGASLEDFTTLLIQTSTDLDVQKFANLLIEALNSNLALPEPDEVVISDYLEWTLYTLTFDTQTEPVILQIMTASDGRLAYMVALLSRVEDADELRKSILIPLAESVQYVDE